VNWFSSAWHAVTHPGQLVSDGEHLLGEVADQDAYALGSGLNHVGLGSVGQWVEHLGDETVSALDPELQLGQTDDPTLLIHGDPGAIRATASNLGTFSGAFGRTASGLEGMDSSTWTGAAADAFRAKYAPQPGKWRDASTASGDASEALGSYSGTVEWAQGQAREAIALYAEGQRVTATAVTAYNDQVTAYNAAAQAYDTNLAAGQNPGPRPTEPGPFSDPGVSLREHAQEILSAARAERNRAGAQAASVVSRGTDLAPAEPGFWSQVGDTFSDEFEASQLASASFDAGILTGTADIVKVVRDVNVMDPWNMTHPAEYVAGVSALGAGLVSDVVNPQDLVEGVVGTGWNSDPAFAMGKLVPQVALAAATGGAGTGADAAADAAANAATDVSEDAAAQLARSPETDMTTVGDPVDVATGDVVVGQTDVRLAGRLPLTVQRMHRSSYRGGRWFGRSWASTLDQRLVVAGRTVAFAAEGGVVLCYPRPAGGEPVLPLAGPRWPLARDGEAYTVTDPQSGVVRRFVPRSGFYLSAAGEGELPLVLVTDRAGHRMSFGYAQDGAPESITHDGGYQIRVIVSGGRVAALALAGAGPDGVDVPLARYGYDAAGDLAEVVNSSGLPQRFSYDEAGRLTGWEDRNGWSYRYHYDGSGRCVRGEGPDGALSGVFGYDRDNGVTTYTDAAGAVTAYQITHRSQVAAITDPLGSTTRFGYLDGRLVSRTDPLGRTTRWSYDAAGNLAGVTRPDGSRAVAVYNELNLPLAVTGPDGATRGQDYDAAGNLVRRVGPDGGVTRYAYDERGHLAAVTGPDGAAVRMECDAAGLPVAVTDPNGARTRYERDGFGQFTAVTGPDGSVTRLAWTVEGLPASRTFPDGAVERYAYDGEGNLIGHIDPARGVTTFEYGSFNQLLARIWPDGTRTSFVYDHALRLTTVTHGKLTWRYDHDPAGRLVAETDYNGAVTRYVRDAAGQLTRRVNAAGQELDLAYDPLGNLTERVAGGAVTRFGYDPAGRLIRASSPGAELEFERDATGRVTAESCNGSTVRSGYDAAGRRVLRVTPTGAQARWDYDTAGRLAALQTAGQELRFGYDQAGRETFRELPGGLRLTQEWDTAGRLAAQVLASTGPARTSPPSAGLPPLLAPGPSLPGAAQDGRLLQRRSYAYRADGCLAAVDDLLSGPRQLTLDAAGRVTAVAGPDWAEQYGYDPAGNITAAAWPAPPSGPGAWLGVGAQGPREYAGTLITRAGGVRYQHDALGRITMRQRVRLSGKPDTWRYEWDADNRLTAVTTPDGTVWRYRYDPLGRRIAKQRLASDGQVAGQTSFTWDGPILAEQATSGGGTDAHQVTTWDYRPGTFTPLTQLTRPAPADHDSWRDAPQDQVDSQFYTIVTDLIGAPSEFTAADGTLAGYQQRTLWGVTLWHPGGTSTPLRFPGQYEDPETGLHYNHHRYYDPATGRYLTPDPLGLAPAPNPHAYVLNPHILADPLGLDPAGVAGGKSNFMAPDDITGQNAMTAPLEPGYHDVIIHGNPTGFGISGWGVTPNDLAQLLRQDPGYAGGPIRLISCSTGSQWGGAAQQLADELGVEVRAPTHLAWTHPDGSLTIGPSRFSRVGRWISFSPTAPADPISFGNEVLNDSPPVAPPP
jgi:RHS repeat-associated protein